MVDSTSKMPTKWKLRDFLEAKGITVYALSKELEGQVSITTLYSLKNRRPKRLDLEGLDALIPALERLTGERVELTDLLEFTR